MNQHAPHTSNNKTPPFWRTVFLHLGVWWKKLSETLAIISGTLLLSIAYFIFLLPLAFVMRLSKKSPMRSKPAGSSYYTSVDHVFTREDLENVW